MHHFYPVLIYYKITDNLTDPSFAKATDEGRKGRWVIFTLLNQMEIQFRYLKKNHVHDVYVQKAPSDLLIPLLKNKDAVDLINKRAYNPGLVKYCHTLDGSSPIN